MKKEREMPRGKMATKLEGTTPRRNAQGLGGDKSKCDNGILSADYRYIYSGTHWHSIFVMMCSDLYSSAYDAGEPI